MHHAPKMASCPVDQGYGSLTSTDTAGGLSKTTTITLALRFRPSISIAMPVAPALERSASAWREGSFGNLPR